VRSLYCSAGAEGHGCIAHPVPSFGRWCTHATADGSQYQDALAKLTGRRTVPNIFIKRKSVGGCDDLHDLHAAGKLTAML